MSKKLVIVESPTKAKTISKFLGSDYIVEASYGHVRDLPKSKISIDVEHDFTPKYIIPPKAEEVVQKLGKLARKAESIILATDEDREGESISWHLVDALGLNSKKNKIPYERIVFHEITKPAIEHALANPRQLDNNLVDAQQARRVLDRLVGYELSPFLWRKIRYGLSAGRVQSVAVRLIVEREREIQAFKAQEYWSVLADLKTTGSQTTFSAKVQKKNEKALGKFGIPTEADALEIKSVLAKADFTVGEIESKETNRYPAPPFTTSTLQQEAARKLGYTAKQTMMVAQKLYELGHITYMRTDSVNLAASSMSQAEAVLENLYGARYAVRGGRRFKTKSRGAQEAHEAIRPTDVATLPEQLSKSIDRSQARLYKLIWQRMLASQASPAVLEQTGVDIVTNTAYSLRATGQVILFDGFMRVYTEGSDEISSDDETTTLPKLTIGDALQLESITPKQHFTEPPARYTDATLVKALEANGIGRPSTYAPTLSTIQERGYVTKTEKKYAPTETGFAVTDMLVEHFPNIVDVTFTSQIETELDEIAEGTQEWVPVIREFYDPFKSHLKIKEAEVEKQVTVSTTPCPHCSKPMLIKFGRMGQFLACPEEGSKVTQPMPEEAAEKAALAEKTKDERCELCGSTMDVKKGRFGYFLGCSNYPTCKGISKIWNKTGFKCPHCLQSELRSEKPGDVVEKKSRGRGKPFYACTKYPDCDFVMNVKPESETQLQELYQEFLQKKDNPKTQAKARKPVKKRNTKIVKKKV